MVGKSGGLCVFEFPCEAATARFAPMHSEGCNWFMGYDYSPGRERSAASAGKRRCLQVDVTGCAHLLFHPSAQQRDNAVVVLSCHLG